MAAPTLLHCPARQSVQDVEPGTVLAVPALQLEQAAAPAARPNFPAGHSRQARAVLAPLVDENRPLAHWMQAVDVVAPSTIEYVP
jgi:hypothetical protein